MGKIEVIKRYGKTIHLQKRTFYCKECGKSFEARVKVSKNGLLIGLPRTVCSNCQMLNGRIESREYYKNNPERKRRQREQYQKKKSNKYLDAWNSKSLSYIE